MADELDSGNIRDRFSGNGARTPSFRSSQTPGKRWHITTEQSRTANNVQSVRNGNCSNGLPNVRSSVSSLSQRLERARGNISDAESSSTNLNIASTPNPVNNLTSLARSSVEQIKVETNVPRRSAQESLEPERARGNDEEGAVESGAQINVAGMLSPVNREMSLAQWTLEQSRITKNIAYRYAQKVHAKRQSSETVYPESSLKDGSDASLSEHSFEPQEPVLTINQRLERARGKSLPLNIIPGKLFVNVDKITGLRQASFGQDVNESQTLLVSERASNIEQPSTSQSSDNQTQPTQESQTFRTVPPVGVLSQERGSDSNMLQNYSKPSSFPTLNSAENAEFENLNYELKDIDPSLKIHELCLKHLVLKHNLQMSEFRVSCTNATLGLYSASVMIGDYPFCSVEECKSPLEATESTAKYAYTFLVDFYRQGETTTEAATVVARLKEVLGDNIGLSSSIPLYYKMKYKEHLPCDWLEIAKNSPEFIVNQRSNGVYEILVNQNESPVHISSHQNLALQEETREENTAANIERAVYPRFPRLSISKTVEKFAWDEAFKEAEETETQSTISEERNVGNINQQSEENVECESSSINQCHQHSRCVFSLGNIPETPMSRTVKFPDGNERFRVSVFIVEPNGNAYVHIVNEEFEELCAKLDNLGDYIRRRLVFEYAVGNYYCVFDDNSWRRVRLDELNEHSITVYFIDWGDTINNKYTIKDLCDIPDDLKEYRAQAVPCRFSHVKFPTLSYAGYEDIYDRISTFVYENILSKTSLIAEVDRTSDPGSLILYDEESNENVNLALMSEVVATLTMPVKVPESNQSAPGRVAYINECGATFLHMNVENMDIITLHLNMLAELIIGGKMSVNKSQNLFCGILYLYLDIEKRSGYRVKVLRNSREEKISEIDVFMVDFGKVKTVLKKDLFELKFVSYPLTCVKHQAVETTLVEISESTDTGIVEEMITAFPEGTLVSVTTISDSEVSVPIVSLTKLKQKPLPSYMTNSRRNSVVQEQCYSSDTEQSDDDWPQPKNKLRFCGERQAKRNTHHYSTQSAHGKPARKLFPICPTEAVIDPTTYLPNTEKFASSNVILSTTRSPPQTSCFIINVLEYPLPAFMAEADMQVEVLQAVSPSEFWIELKHMRDEYKIMHRKMQDYYKTFGIDDGVIEPYSACAIRQDDLWYRGLRLPHGSVIAVRLVDRGTITLVSEDNIAPLEPRFARLPPAAILAYIYDLKPVNKDWSADDCVTFQKLVCKKNLVATFLKKPKKTKQAVYLLDMSKKTFDEANISMILVSENRAVFRF